MKILFSALIIMMFGLFRAPALAQDAGWEIEQRCLPEPVAAPADWSFDGTILLRGSLGIHGVRSDWDVPRVLVFLNQEWDLPGGALSPDGRWYASPWGHSETTETYNHLTIPDEIRIYSTVDGRIYQVPFRDLFAGGTFSRVVWLDNDHFLYHTGINRSADDLYGVLRINPFTQEITYWEPQTLLGENVENLQFISPDGTLTAYNSGSWALHQMESGVLLNVLPFHRYGDITFAWSPDSSQFAGLTASSQLNLYDRSGTRSAMLMSLQDVGILPDSLVWSSDGRYLAFILNTYNQNNLYIADVQQQKIIDTCFVAKSGAAWIGSSHQLAFGQADTYANPTSIIVTDMDSYVPYIVAYHKGRIIYWRSD